MADSIYLGRNTKSFNSSPRFGDYDMVILNLDENNYISSPYVTVNASKWTSSPNGEHIFTYNGSAWEYNESTYTESQLSSTYGIVVTYSSATAAKIGDTVIVSKITNNGTQTVTASLTRSGHVFEVDCPLVKPSQRQTVADALLAKVYGFSYQPYEAGGAFINPAAELGDAITAFGVYGGLYKQNITFGRLMCADIGAPLEQEIDNEFQYKTSQERRYARKFADIAAEFVIQADQISAKVSKTGSNSSNTFSWQLQSDHFSVFSGSNEMLRIDSSGSSFAGVVKANSIATGTITIGGTTYNAGYVTGSQIGTGTVTGGSGGNIAGTTVTSGNTTFSSTLTQVGTNKSNIEALQQMLVTQLVASTITCSTLYLGPYNLYVTGGGAVYGRID